MSNNLPDIVPGRLPTWDDSRVRMSDEAVVIQHSWHALRRLCGITLVLSELTDD